jgi:glyoxylase-like metal-dependent hydrolase (beta-lactamase superfamily II)
MRPGQQLCSAAMSKPKIMIVPVTPFQQNCALIWDEDTKTGTVVDPGGDVDVILKAIAQAGCNVEKILLTHGHIDHAGGAAELSERLGVAIEGPHEEDLFLLERLTESGAQYGMSDARPVVPGRWLREGDVVEAAGLTFSIFECPGHTPGSVVFFNAEHKFCLIGDVLFQGSIGRTDFPRGDHTTLLRSIREKIFPLGDDVTFLPGHGRPGRVGEERQTNPFLT